jgi:Ni,Fe-hydrogenase III small subunit
MPLEIRQWVLQGFRTGIMTTPYPAAEERAKGVSPGVPRELSEMSEGEAARLVATCPTGAIESEQGRVRVDLRRCVHCFRCAREPEAPLVWEAGYEWARFAAGGKRPAWPSGFSKSLHIRVVDAGDCGACLSEVKQLNNPYYNMHRLGFFLTPSPRNADILLVVGPVTDQMRRPLLETYEAMPTPKLVMAVGACALSGGVFGSSIFSGSGVGSFLPVDIEVPGAPPPPLAILHGLLVAAGRKAPAPEAASSLHFVEGMAG